jgi:hypothetical protein
MSERETIRNDGGAVAIIVSVFLLVMFGLLAIVADLGYAREQRREAQNAADAAALAGASALYYGYPTLAPSPGYYTAPQFSQATDAVEDYVADNVGISDWSDCPLGAPPSGYSTQGSGTNCITYRTGASGVVTNVAVTIPVEISPLFFGFVTGAVSGPDITATALGELNPSLETQCALCVREFVSVGTGDVYVKGGGSMVAGDGSVQQVNGKLVVETPGSIEFTQPPSPVGSSWPPYGSAPQGTDWPITTSGSGVSATTPLVTGRPVVDPYQSVALPPLPDAEAVNVNRCRGSLAPGVYRDITVRAGETCSLDGGLYVIVGELKMGANSSTKLVATAPTTLYFSCRNPATNKAKVCDGTESAANQGNLDNAGSSFVGLAAPLSPYPWSIVYDRLNTDSLELSGNGNSVIDGALYAIGAEVTLSGSGNSPDMLTVNAPVVLGRLTLNGQNANLFVNAPGLTPRFRPPDVTLGG